jgi:hypothetical protein
VSITVTVPSPPVNRLPVAVNDVATTNAGVAVSIAVLANDSDPDGDALTVSSTADFVGGPATVVASGAVTFTPAAGFSGTGSFTYAVADGKGGSATGSVSVTVNAPPASQPGLVLALGFNESSGTLTAIRPARRIMARCARRSSSPAGSETPSRSTGRTIG